jgi:hypothetical protein
MLNTSRGVSWKAVGWCQKRGNALKSKKLTETPYIRSIKQLRKTAQTFLGQHWITNIPSSVGLFNSPMEALTLWLTSDAIKD